LGGSLKAEGFGDGKCMGNHPQAALEAATLIEIAAATCCGPAMTIAEVPDAETESSETKNHLPENLGTLLFATDGMIS